MTQKEKIPFFNSLVIEKVTIETSYKAAILFDLYRQFYKQESDLKGAWAFLKERLINHESLMWIALNDEEPIGFMQIYPLFSSIDMQKIWVLNDLFTKQEKRSQGVGTQLLKKAFEQAKQEGVLRIEIKTEIGNKKAQDLYEHMGFSKDKKFIHFSH